MAFHMFQTDHTTTFEELAEFFKDIEKLVKNIYAKIEGINVDVFIPVEWDPVNDRQLISEWDGVVVVRADSKLSERERRKAILHGYHEYRKLLGKEDYPRKHIVRTKTTFLFTVDELLADTEEKAKWEEYRRKKKARKG